MASSLLRATAVVFLMLTAGCSVRAEKGDPAADSRFDNLVGDFVAANTKLQPGQTECNVGGLAQACGDSSLEIAAMIDEYLPKLRSAAADASGRAHGDEFIDAVELYAEGLRERTRGMAEEDNSLFRSGNDKIRQSAEQWEAALAALQDEAAE